VAAAAASPERAVEAMRSVSATGRQALGDTRRLLGVLRDQHADERQPVPDLGRLDELIARVRSTGLPVTYEVTGVATDLPAGVQLTVFRLVQEALTNTLKHAGDSAQATVRVRYAPDEVCVDVEDDGAGTAAPVPMSAGAGLIGMRERVQTYGGDLRTGPGHGGGWRVSARLRIEGTT
jgi:signal transduction histidine kinase